MGWKEINTAPERQDILILDSENNIRIGYVIKTAGGMMLARTVMDFGDFEASAFWPKDLVPLMWQQLPEVPTDV